jgi:hypothetical protein
LKGPKKATAKEEIFGVCPQCLSAKNSLTLLENNEYVGLPTKIDFWGIAFEENKSIISASNRE